MSCTGVSLRQVTSAGTADYLEPALTHSIAGITHFENKAVATERLLLDDRPWTSRT